MRVVVLFCLLFLAACGGDPGGPGSLTAHMNGRVNGYVAGVSQSH